MTFDSTITFGNLLTIAAMLGGGMTFIWMMKSDLKLFSQRLTTVEAVMHRVTDALVALAKQEARLDAHADRISRLEQQD